MERAIRPWLTTNWMFNLSSLGKENRQCVKALHEFTNQVRLVVLQRHVFGCYIFSLLNEQVIEDRRLALKQNENPLGELNNNNLGDEKDTKSLKYFVVRISKY